MTTQVDVAVIGAGPGGYVAAIRAAQLGKSVAVVEGRFWGGVCLNIGCVPSKALLRNAEIAHILRHESELFGISGTFDLDYGAAVDRSRSVADDRAKGVRYLMRKNHILEIDGWASFSSDHSIDVALADGGTERVEFGHAIIATGATTNLLPGVDLSDNVVTYETMIRDRDLPSSLAIVGGGAIGVEFASIMRSYGVRVHLLEAADRLLPGEDRDVSRELERQYRRMGVEIATSTLVQEVDDRGDHVHLAVTGRDGETHDLDVDRVLVSIGFSPRVGGFGLESTGVALDERGAITIDDDMRTTVPHIFAIGDVTGRLPLAHVAEAQGVVAAETLAGAETMALDDYRMMPRAVFSRPQVASFGLTEEQARAEGRDIAVSRFPFSANAKAHGLGAASGFVKLIAEGAHGELIGAHMIGPEVAELLPELTLARRWDLGAPELARNVHTHPTLSEALQEAIHGLNGHMINL